MLQEKYRSKTAVLALQTQLMKALRTKCGAYGTGHPGTHITPQALLANHDA